MSGTLPQKIHLFRKVKKKHWHVVLAQGTSRPPPVFIDCPALQPDEMKVCSLHVSEHTIAQMNEFSLKLNDTSTGRVSCSTEIKGIYPIATT